MEGSAALPADLEDTGTTAALGGSGGIMEEAPVVDITGGLGGRGITAVAGLGDGVQGA